MGDTISRAWDEYGDTIIDTVVKLAIAVLMWVLGSLIIGKLSKLAEKAMLAGGRTDPTIAGFVASLVRIGLKIVLAIMVMGQVGVENGQFVAVIGAAVFALAFALEGLMGNMASGVMIMTFRPFGQGDTVNVGGEEGIVSKIQLFNTMLMSPQGKVVIVPNAEITDNNITNFCANPQLRLDIDFAFEYDTGLKPARDLLMDVLDTHELVLSDPPADVVVKELGEEHLLLTARPWVEPTGHLESRYAIIEEVLRVFGEADIGIMMPDDEEEEEEEEEEDGGDDADDLDSYSGTNFLLRRRTKALKGGGWMDGIDMMDDKEREESAHRSLTTLRAALAAPPAILKPMPDKAELQRKRDEEKALVAAATGKQRKAGDPFYFVHKGWLDEWKRFAAGGPDRPGRIRNHALLTDAGLPKKGLTTGQDYRAVSKELWDALFALYGGGPPIMKATANIYGR